MKKPLTVTILAILYVSMFSILAPSLVRVNAGSPPGKVDNFSFYPSGSYELLIWGNPLINGFPDTSVTAFKIYKDGSLLTTVDWRTCRYRDYSPVNRWCQYGISAVNAAGEGPQYTGWEWWGPGFPNVYYDLTLYCNPPEGGCLTEMFTLRSGQTTAGNVGMPAMVNAVPAAGYNFTGQWTKTGSISISYYYPQPTCYIDNWWGNDATITASFQKLPTHDVSISAHCITEGMDVNVPITMDGSSTGYNTPHNFPNLTSSHTFGVPSTDPSGHPFVQWSTGQTTPTITVSSNGTYIAYYQSDTYDAVIAAHCYQEGVAISLPIIRDGSSTGFNTSHIFTGLKGNHTFTVLRVDSKGHVFSQWNTGQTTTTITIGSGATYTAYYARSYIELIDFRCSQESVTSGKNFEAKITGTNTGTTPESRLVAVTLNGRTTQYASLNLQPGQTGSVPVVIRTQGLPSGDYSVTLTDDELRARGFMPPVISVQGKSYFIIIAGNDRSDGNYKAGIADDCNHAYNVLVEKLKVDKSRICYLAPETQYDSGGNPITSGSSTQRGYIEWALSSWAKSQMNSFNQLFIYLHGHGEVGKFVLDTDQSGSTTMFLWSGDLDQYLRVRRNGYSGPIYLIYDACHSGSFIADYNLDHDATAIICSCKSSETTLATPDISLHWHSMFGSNFWTAIGEGKSVYEAYNKAGWDLRELVAKLLLIPNLFGKSQTPVFDDIHSGNEFYGVSSVLGSKVPGPNGEGKCLTSSQMGNCEWAFPWISSVIQTQYYSWPPPADLQIWAVVRNDTALCNMTAFMLPPDLVSENETLCLEPYQMADTRGDGNFSVRISSFNFTSHASGPSVFSFLLVPKQKDGMASYMCIVDVVFTQTGQPPADSSPPAVTITRPMGLDTVSDILVINGSVHDDVCLQKVELSVDGSFAQRLNLLGSSSSYFQFDLNTIGLANGYHNITVNAFDTSNNHANETVGVWVENNVHDVAAAFLNLPKTVIAKGATLSVEANIVNRGTYAENVTISFLSNSTVVETRAIGIVPAGGVVSVAFAWNTSQASYADYVMTVGSNALSNESDTDNNAYNLVIHVSISGDINGDNVVDILDAVGLAGSYGSVPNSTNWNANTDINNDTIVDILDAILLAGNYGRTV